MIWEAQIRKQVLDDYDQRYESERDVAAKTVREVWIDMRWLIDRLREARLSDQHSGGQK